MLLQVAKFEYLSHLNLDIHNLTAHAHFTQKTHLFFHACSKHYVAVMCGYNHPCTCA